MKKPTRVELKKRRRRRFFRFLLILILTFSGIVFALRSSFFTINNINVVGNKNIEKNKLIETSSILLGENIFKAKLKNAEKNIEKLPYTKEINIKRKLPKQVEIDILERKEIAQVREGRNFLIIDKEGQILETIKNESENSPIIIGLKVDNKSKGKKIFDDTESKLEFKFIEESSEIKILEKIRTIDITNISNVNMRLINGTMVRFGSLDNVEYKLSLLEGVLDYIEAEEIQSTMIIMNRGENPIIVTSEGG